jgi:hypothetical protein
MYDVTYVFFLFCTMGKKRGKPLFFIIDFLLGVIILGTFKLALFGYFVNTIEEQKKMITNRIIGDYY